MDNIDIRQALATDSEDILAMLIQLAEELGEGDRFCCRIEHIRDYGFGDHSLFQCLIASRGQHKGSEKCGLALFFPVFSTTRGQPGVYLQDLWVSPACRDAGLGIRLLSQIIDHATQQWQASYLDLMVHGDNKAAERFYRRYGFVEYPHDRHLSLDGDAFRALQNENRLPSTS